MAVAAPVKRKRPAQSARVWLDFLARTGAVISSEAAKAAESRNLAVLTSQRQRPRRDFSTRFARSK